VLQRNVVPKPDTDSLELYNTYIILSTSNVKYTRTAYNILDLLGDTGGIFEVVMLLFGWLMFPISEYSFILKAAKRLFLARTTDHEMFEYTKCDKQHIIYKEVKNS